MTLLPQLAIDELSAVRQKRVKPIAEPRPVRQVALLTMPGNPKKRMVEALAKIVRASVPEGLRAIADQDHVLDRTQ